MKNIKYDLGLISGSVFIKDKFIKTSVGIKNNKITYIGKISPSHCKKFLILKNKLILPGFVDTQVHFREPGLTHKEDLEHGTRAALLGGITTIFEMPNTSPATINKKELDRKISIARKKSWTNYSFFIGAC